jgi:ferrochelatase
MSQTAVVLLNLGGPDSLDSVEPFLYNLFSDRDIIRGFWGLPLPKFVARKISRTRGPSVRANYALIGGKSPQLELTRKQADALSQKLDLPVAIAMRYWHPFAHETLAELAANGTRRIIALTCYPHFSGATTGSSLIDLKRALAAHPDIELGAVVDRYAEDPGYIAALAETIREQLSPGTQVLFSAHSLPITFVKRGDPYPGEIQRTIDAVVRALKIEDRWHLSYQSRVGRIKWLEPSTEVMLHELAQKGHKDVLVVPISFVSDHIETLQEIDILYKGVADQLGISGFRRARTFNDDPRFIDALARLVKAATAGPLSEAQGGSR